MNRAKSDGENVPRALDQHNWERWGDGDQVGALNLLTPQQVVRAAQSVRSGICISLAREYPTWESDFGIVSGHDLDVTERPDGSGYVTESLRMDYHGPATTHIDALCHEWGPAGMWGGRDPAEVLTASGSHWAGVEHWKKGIVARAALADIPSLRGEPHVTMETPVQGWEIDAALRRNSVEIEPGDALVVYCGLSSWREANPGWHPEKGQRPGLDPSCLSFIREKDVSTLAWDMMDAQPNWMGMTSSVHAALFSYGVAIIDNCELEPIVAACDGYGRHDFLLVVAPLRIRGGTGSPVNPIAVL